MEKKCNKCNVVKDVGEFNKTKRNKDGLDSICRECGREKAKRYREANKEKIKQYYQSNKQRIIDRVKKYDKVNKEQIKIRKKQWRQDNKEHIKEYYLANKEKKKKYSKEYAKANKDKLRERARKHYDANKETIANKSKQYREDNKEKLKEKRKQYYETNKERIANYQKKYAKANEEKLKEKRKQYYEVNKDKRNQYRRHKIKTDNLFRLKRNISKGIQKYLKDGKSKRTREIIGISYKEFKDYLEVEYTKNMHLDHIIPQSWTINDEEVYTLNHYSNFQIITAEENLAKSDTYCKSENLKKVLDNHNDLAKLNKIIERNSDKIT